MRFDMSHVYKDINIEEYIKWISSETRDEILEAEYCEIISNEIFNWFNQAFLCFYENNWSIQIINNSSNMSCFPFNFFYDAIYQLIIDFKRSLKFMINYSII
jgi:hypothetical protein